MEEKKDDFRHILRVAGTDLNGGGKMINELRKINGVSFMLANVICVVTQLDPNQKMGYVEEGVITKIEDVLKNPTKYNIPTWMFNRRSDPEDGTTKHLFGADLKFTHENDIRMMKKMRSYKGVRHSIGQPVRGQRTKSNFRVNKGKVSGVAKSRQAKAAAKPAGGDKGKK